MSWKNKAKYCKKCGNLIDPISKKCSGCGRRYFKLAFCKKHIYPIISVTLILGLSVGFIYQTYQKNQILDQKNSALDFKQSTIDSLRDEIDRLESKLRDAEKTNLVIERKASLLDDCIGLISENNNFYHKYGCEDLDTESGFISYNKLMAEYKGYKPCPKCYSDD